MADTAAALNGGSTRAKSDYSVWVYAASIAYVAGYLLFPPRALLIIDEFHYVAQALAFSQGKLVLTGSRSLYPPPALEVASDYPPGTSLLQTPLVALTDWRGASLLSVISLVVATLVTMRWLRDQHREPGFALLVLAFVGSLLFGRVAMSDMPSAAWIALAVWALFRARAHAAWSFAAGLLGSGSILLRETNAVLLAPIFIGALVRGKCHRGALIIGILGGVALRLGLAQALFGDALYLRDSQYGFSIASVGSNLLQYAVITLLLLPFAALLPFFYRGPRRAELVVSFWLYLAMVLSYDYGGSFESGRIKGLILVSRYIVPMLPLLAFMAADVWPPWLATLSSHWRRLTQRMVPVALSTVTAATFFVHPVIHREEQELLPVIRLINASTSASVPVITNHQATLKYFSPAYGARSLILRSYLTPSEVPGFVRKYDSVNVVFLDRDDSEMYRADAAENTTFLESLRRLCELHPVHDTSIAGMRLHVHAVRGCVAQ